jgi:photosystem II stability/assembly factor-like uncharacterized protein
MLCLASCGYQDPSVMPSTPPQAPVVPTSTSRGTVISTTDGWKHWTSYQTPFDEDDAVAICPTATTCYVTSNGKIWRTSDSGKTWRMVGKGGYRGFREHPIDCSDEATCIIANEEGVVVTTDGGQTWNSYPFLQEFDATGISCPSQTTCVAVGWNLSAENPLHTILVTQDGGKSWEAQLVGTRSGLGDVSCPTEHVCFAVGYDVTGEMSYRSGTIVATTDGGRTWNVQSSDQTMSLRYISCPNPTTCYAFGNGGLKTTDGGKTWSEMRVDNPVPFNGVNCPTATTCFITTNDILLVTHDGGTTWQPRGPGLSAGSISCPSEDYCMVVRYIVNTQLPHPYR